MTGADAAGADAAGSDTAGAEADAADAVLVGCTVGVLGSCVG